MNQVIMNRFGFCLLLSLFFTAWAQATPLTWGSQAVGDIASCDGQEMICYAPGIIRADQGTVQMTVLMEKPSTELGSGWESLFNMVPAQNIGGNSLLTLIFPELSYNELGLWLVGRSNDTGPTSSAKIFAPAISFTAGQTVHLAFTWGSGELRVYFNGTRIGTAAFAHNITPMPAVFRVARLSPFRTQSMKISSVQLADATIAVEAQNALVADADTTFLAVDSLATAHTYTTPWHSLTQYTSVTPYWSPRSQCFVLGDSITYPILTVNQTTAYQYADVIIDVYGSEGDHLLQKIHSDISLLPSEGYKERYLDIPGMPTLPGFYRIHTSMRVGSATHIQYDSNIVVIPAPQTGVSDGAMAQYLGYHYDFSFDAQPLQQMGVHWVRMWGVQPFLWYNIEPVAGQYLWDTADKVIQQAAANDLQLLGLLGNMPRWATVEPDEAHKALHPLANVPCRWKPRDMAEWENYAAQVMDRYKNDIKHWEVCNEIDFHPPGIPASFSGTTAEYFQMLQRVYSQSRLIGQDLKVLLSGLSLGSVCDPAMPTDLINMGACDYLDAFNMHAYEGLKHVGALKTAVHAVKPGLPFWQTEQMWMNISHQETRLWLTPAIYLWFMDEGFEKFFTFGFYDMYFDRSTLSPSKDHYVNTVFQNQVRVCSNYAGLLSFAGDTSFSVRHQLHRTDGKTLTVIGSEAGVFELTLNDQAGTTAVDLMGHPVAVEHAGGQMKLTVTDMAYIVSSQPLVVTSVVQLSVAQLLFNGGFEDVIGDISMGGLEAGTPANWTLRQTTYDPQGSIVLTTDAHSGAYAMKVNSSGAGQVYLFEDVRIPVPGFYLVTAHLKKTDPSTAGIPFIRYYDRDHNLITTQTLADVTTSYQAYSMLIYVDQVPPSAVALIIGIDSGAGEILVDDVDFKPAQLIDNSGFETLIGNVPANWTLRQTTYDPLGSIVLSTDAHTDTYAMQVNSSGAGRVYLFSDVTIPAAGDYLLTAHLKKTDPLSTAAPYLSFYDRQNNVIKVQTLPSVTAAYQPYSMIMHFDSAPSQDVALMAGIYTGTGELLVDDVDFKPVKLMVNGGFEKIIGDIDTIGLEACTPANWTLRQTTYDPGGSILLTPRKHLGAYAMKVNSTGAGRVYLFEDVIISAPGDYLFTAYLKKTDALSTAVPYLSYYDRDHNLIPVQTLSGVTDAYQSYSMSIHFDEALPTPVALIVGIYTGSGELLVDDVDFTANQ